MVNGTKKKMKNKLDKDVKFVEEAFLVILKAAIIEFSKNNKNEKITNPIIYL